MPVEAACPSCEGKFRLPDAAAGKKIRCPKCKGPLEVPPLGAETAPATAPSPAVTTPTPIINAPTINAPTSTAINDNLKTSWRGAPPEPAPVEQPRKETPRVEIPQTQPTATPAATPSKPAAVIANPKPSSVSSDAPKKTAAPTTASSAPKLKPPESAPLASQTPSAELWFLKGENGETFGPVDRATLDSWHGEGRMTADSQLLKHGTEQWQWASDVYPDLEEPEPEPGTPSAAAATSSIHQIAATTAGSGSVSRKSKVLRTSVPAEDDDQEDVQLSPHSKPVAFLLGLTLGMFGIHRFYLGYVGIGLAMFFTFGGLLMWSITDSLRILFGHVTDSEGLKLRD